MVTYHSEFLDIIIIFAKGIFHESFTLYDVFIVGMTKFRIELIIMIV